MRRSQKKRTTRKRLPRGKQRGFSLIFDVVRRFARNRWAFTFPTGKDASSRQGRVLSACCRSQSARDNSSANDGAEAVANQLEQHSGGVVQLALFTESAAGETRVIGGRGRRKKRSSNVAEEALSPQRETTTLDRVHAAILLQSTGRANALRALSKPNRIVAPDFLRLANALSALYPKAVKRSGSWMQCC